MPDRWFEGKIFTTDWTTKKIPVWQSLLPGLLAEKPVILEVGCYEGRSVVVWLELFPNSHVTCIDSFEGWTNEPIPQDRSLAEAKFDANLAPYAGRVTKLKIRSAPGLDGLRGKQFDLIYIDGDHSRAAVAIDSLLAWPLLKPKGVLIWDDYILHRKEPQKGPGQAIDLFLTWYADELEIVHKTYQVIVRKLHRSGAKAAAAAR
jgi:predicted O-methyltransferase YrrM